MSPPAMKFCKCKLFWWTICCVVAFYDMITVIMKVHQPQAVCIEQQPLLLHTVWALQLLLLHTVWSFSFFWSHSVDPSASFSAHSVGPLASSGTHNVDLSSGAQFECFWCTQCGSFFWCTQCGSFSFLWCTQCGSFYLPH